MSAEQPAAMREGLEQVRQYWDQRAAQCGSDCERVEQSRRTQRMRFEIFVRAHDLRGRALLDVGCGTGDLLDHLRRRGIACDYCGLDLSENMIRRARERFPEARFRVGDSLAGLQGAPFDYTVSIGIHNVKVPGAWDLLASSMHQQFAACRVAAHLSLLTDRYDRFADHIQAWKVEDVLGLALSITPYVALRNDYLPNDFSVTLYRAPLIDTDSSLMLD